MGDSLMRIDRKLRVGLVGAGGGISRLRGNAVKAHPRAEVSLCYEADKSRYDRVRERYPGIPIAGNPDELLTSEAVDAVIISTPNTSHYEYAEKALKAGKHVCVEYPMVQTLEEYDRLVAPAKEQGVVLHDGLTPRIENYHLSVKRRLPQIGAPLSVYYGYFLGKWGWYWKEEKAGDFFVIVTIHQLEHVRDLFGRVTTVHANMAAVKVAEGMLRCAQVALGFENGATAVIENGWGLPNPPDLAYRVIGSEGTIVFATVGKESRTVLRKPGREDEREDIQIDFQKTLGDDTNAFLAEILDGADPVAPLSDGREALRLCLLMGQSAREGVTLRA